MQHTSLSSAMCKVFFAASILSFASCQKEKVDSSNDDTGFATDQAQLEKTYDDVLNIADEAASNNALTTYKVTSACATVTHDSTSTPRRVTVNFGSTDCLCSDGVYRRGSIILTYEGKYRDTGYVHTISFDSFYVNDNQVTGTKSVTNMGHNLSGQLYYNIVVNGSIILDKGAGTRSWSSTRTRTWVAGSTTIGRGDDIYNITGSGSVTRVDGSIFTANITSPLVVDLSCDWINKGTVVITPKSGVIRTLDYGTGTCDATATMTVGTKVYTVTLHK